MAENTPKYIRVTGAAGYIGSVITEALANEGERVISLDNLTQGHRESVDSRTTFIRGDLADPVALDALFRKYLVGAVVHLAARTLVGESVTDPAPYFRDNLGGGLNLLDAMRKYRVNKMVFSS